MPSTTYMHRPTKVQAMCLEDKSCIIPIVQWLGARNAAWVDGSRCQLAVKTPEGIEVANQGDYVVQDADGTVRPCKAGIFHLNYEEVK